MHFWLGEWTCKVIFQFWPLLPLLTQPYSFTRQLSAQLLHPFETVRPGTEVFSHNMLGNKPHWLDQDVRRLRLHCLPNDTFGKVALFSRVPYDSISLRDCTAKR